jgi:hypothetical protein
MNYVAKIAPYAHPNIRYLETKIRAPTILHSHRSDDVTRRLHQRMTVCCVVTLLLPHGFLPCSLSLPAPTGKQVDPTCSRMSLSKWTEGSVPTQLCSASHAYTVCHFRARHFFPQRAAHRFRLQPTRDCYMFMCAADHNDCHDTFSPFVIASRVLVPLHDARSHKHCLREQSGRCDSD